MIFIFNACNILGTHKLYIYVCVCVCDAIFNYQKFNTVPSPFKRFNEVLSHVAQKATDQNYKGQVD